MDEDKKTAMEKMSKAKKITWHLNIVHRVDVKDAIADGGTEEAAKEMRPTRIVKLNDQGMFAIEEKNEIVIVQIHEGILGCACEKFSKSTSIHVLCKHLIHLKALIDTNKLPQLSISSRNCRDIQAYLIETGWSTMDQMLYPHLDSPTSQTQPEVVKELPPIKEDTSPIDEGNGLPPDKGSWKPDEQEEPEKSAEPEDTPKEISRTCSFCGYVVRGTDHAKVKADIAEHKENCKDNPNNKPKVPRDPPEQKPPTEQETPKPEDIPKPTVKKVPKSVENKPAKDAKTSDKVSLYDWIEELVEFGVGQFFGETGTAKTGLCRATAESAADEGKKVVYWDTEGNMTRKQRAAMSEHKNITYILDRDWNHIKNMLDKDLSKGSPKLGKCDLFILDSIGVPVLGIYGTLKQNQKGNALQAMQGLLYRLTIWAEDNDAVVLVTNQPVSEMNKTEAERADRRPFGDKAMFFTKEIMKLIIAERTEYKTVCHVLAWRSRSAGMNRHLCTVTISDNGIEVTPVKRTR